MIKTYLRKEGREMVKAFSVSGFVFILYSAFIYFIGMPMTQAKNELNQCIVYSNAENYTKSQQHCTRSLELWKTDEVQKYLLTDHPTP